MWDIEDNLYYPHSQKDKIPFTKTDINIALDWIIHNVSFNIPKHHMSYETHCSKGCGSLGSILTPWHSLTCTKSKGLWVFLHSNRLRMQLPRTLYLAAEHLSHWAIAACQHLPFRLWTVVNRCFCKLLLLIAYLFLSCFIWANLNCIFLNVQLMKIIIILSLFQPILFTMCVGNEAFYGGLYLLHFTEGPLGEHSLV